MCVAESCCSKHCLPVFFAFCTTSFDNMAPKSHSSGSNKASPKLQTDSEAMATFKQTSIKKAMGKAAACKFAPMKIASVKMEPAGGTGSQSAQVETKYKTSGSMFQAPTTDEATAAEAVIVAKSSSAGSASGSEQETRAV